MVRRGSTSGQLGSAVVLGRVDSTVSLGKFFNFTLLRAGDFIHVTSVSGVVTTFVVNRGVEYARRTFPDRLVYGSNGTIALLVTCVGAIDHATGHYTANIVVFSTLAGSTPPPSAPQ